MIGDLEYCKIEDKNTTLKRIFSVITLIYIEVLQVFTLNEIFYPLYLYRSLSFSSMDVYILGKNLCQE